MKRRISLSLAAALTACLAACETGRMGGSPISPSANRHHCFSADWQQVGIADGIKGFDDVRGRFERLAQNCRKHGANPRWDHYQAGYTEGRRRSTL